MAALFIENSAAIPYNRGEMKHPLFLLAACGLLLLVQSSCSSTAPTAEQLDGYYHQAEQRADARIAKLKSELDQGHMNRDQYDSEVQKIRDDIPRQANDLALAHHQLVESQMREQGIPTGDYHPEPPRPTTGGGGSFYRQGGTYGGGNNGYGGISAGQTGSPTANARFGGF